MGSFLPTRPFTDPRRYGIATPPEEEISAAPLIGSLVEPAVTRAPSLGVGMSMGSGPGAMPVAQPSTVDASGILARPSIGVPVAEMRQRMGLPALAEEAGGTIASPATETDYSAGDAAARARILSGAGAWKPQDAPWGGDVPMGDGTYGKSGLQSAIDDREHAFIDARHARAYDQIDATARRPMQDQIQGASETAMYEDLIPKQRPLYDVGDPAQGGTPGAFHKGADGTISNRLPAMRLGPERAATIAQAPEMRKQQQLANVVAGLEKIQAGIEADMKLYASSGGKEGLSPLDAQKAYERAERLAGLALQSISGGKDFGEFFRPQDPLQTTMALMMGQKANE